MTFNSTKMEKNQKILWINPVGTDLFDAPIQEVFDAEKRSDSRVDVVSLEQKTESLLKKKAKEAVEKDGAEVIILGCTIQFGFYKELQEYVGVPVIDAILAPLKYAEFLIELKDKFAWTHSKISGYESPLVEEIKTWKLGDQYNMKGLWY